MDGINRDVFKDPITDPGKRSLPGRMDVVMNNGGNFEVVTLDQNQISHKDSIMSTIYENGELLVDQNFDDIRSRVLSY